MALATFCSGPSGMKRT